jgi:hypothetical protein
MLVDMELSWRELELLGDLAIKQRELLTAARAVGRFRWIFNAVPGKIIRQRLSAAANYPGMGLDFNGLTITLTSFRRSGDFKRKQSRLGICITKREFLAPFPELTLVGLDKKKVELFDFAIAFNNRLVSLSQQLH